MVRMKDILMKYGDLVLGLAKIAPSDEYEKAQFFLGVKKALDNYIDFKELEMIIYGAITGHDNLLAILIDYEDDISSEDLEDLNLLVEG